jgi:hypothetical protein
MKFCSLDLDFEIDGGDEMFGRHRLAILCDDSHSRFARDKNDETGRFSGGGCQVSVYMPMVMLVTVPTQTRR